MAHGQYLMYCFRDEVLCFVKGFYEVRYVKDWVIFVYVCLCLCYAFKTVL